MVLTNITSDEKKRFMKYQEKGMLPGQALRKIEVERRTGIIEDTGDFLTGKDKWFYIGAGAIGLAILFIYIKARSSPTTQTASMSAIQPPLQNITIDNISGIDLNSLSVCRQKGLM